MAFPIIQFKLTNVDVDNTLQELVRHKLASLERYVKSATDLTCEVEFEKVTTKQHGAVHRIEVNFYRDGQLFRSEATEESFEKAIDIVRSQLDAEMKKANTRHDTLVKRGGRVIKDILRFGR